VNDLKDINQFLNVLESQLAAEFVKYSDVDYLDRTNTLEIFREVHLSSGPAFNPASGALRGLMGRLDYLAVLDSSEPSTARIRLIDVETGAVKAIEACKKRTSFLGISSDTPPDCIPLFVAKAHAVTSVRLASKRDLLQKEQQDNLRAQKLAENQRRKDAEEQRLIERRRSEEAQAAEIKEKQDERAAEAERKENARAAQQLAEQQAKAQAELDSKIAEIKPDLDDALARLAAENDFWRDLEKQLAPSGHSLRPTIRTALNGAINDGRRCLNLLTERDADQLQSCISDLNHRLDVLDAFK
jgi:hypothetical protein